MRQLIKPGVLQVSAAVCAATLMLSACGDSTDQKDSSGASAETELNAGSASNVEQWQHDFTQCMNDEGIELGDGGAIPVNPDGSFGGSEDPAAFDAALQSCEEKIGPPPQDANVADNSELEAMMLEFSRCMREAGYDVPDPDFSSGQGPVVSGVPDADPADVEQCSNEAGLIPGAEVGQ